MKPGDIVICTDARLSEGRLKEGWRYVVKEVHTDRCFINTTPSIPRTGIRLQLIGVVLPDTDLVSSENRWWKSSRFRPLERKEIEDKVNSMIADKILAELAKEE